MGASPDIAIACCRRASDSGPSDLYPDPDSDLLVPLLGQRGLNARKLAWDSPDVSWSDIPLVVVRSTWDSVDRPAEYLAWVGEVAGVSTILNPAPVLAWNLDKSYLLELDAAGVPVIPTELIVPGGTLPRPSSSFVVKPAISAGARETAVYRPEDRVAAEEHVGRLLDQGRAVLVQPYLQAVEDPGEISLVFIDGRFSHAVRKGPVLEAGAPIHDRPWERMVFLGPAVPTAEERRVAERVHEVVHDRFAADLLYSRVDLVADGTGAPLVLEVELIDPYLSLSDEPAAADDLAGAMAQRVQRRARTS